MLVLPYPDRLRVNLYQLGQWVHQPTPYRHCSANRNIILRELVPSYLRGRINRCPAFTHDKHLYISVITQTLDKSFGFTSCRTVTDSNRLDPVRVDQIGNLISRLFHLVLWRMRINGFIMHQISRFIQTNNLTSRAESRIYTQHSPIPKRWCQKQLTQIFSKHLNRFFIRFLLTALQVLCLDRRKQQTFIPVFHRHGHLLGTLVTTFHEYSFQRLDRFLFRDFNRHFQNTFSLPPTNR